MESMINRYILRPVLLIMVYILGGTLAGQTIELQTVELLKKEPWFKQVSSGTDSVFIQTANIEGIEARIVCRRANNRLQNAGLLFSEGFYLAIPDTILSGYISMQMLYLLLADDNDIRKYSEENKFTLQLNGEDLYAFPILNRKKVVELLLARTSRVKYTLAATPDKPGKNYFAIEWEDSTDRVVYTFAADFSALTGMDKVELERRFYDSITRLVHASGFQPVKLKNVPLSELTFASGTDHYIYTGKSMHGYSESAYFVKTDTQYVPVNSLNEYSKTIANYLQGFLPFDEKITVNLEFRLYEGIKRKEGLRFSLLLQMLSKDHYLLSAQDAGRDSMLTTILFYRPEYNYLHLMYFYFPLKEVLSNTPISIEAKIYAYIRMDNVQNFFKEYDEKSKKFKIEIK